MTAIKSFERAKTAPNTKILTIIVDQLNHLEKFIVSRESPCERSLKGSLKIFKQQTRFVSLPAKAFLPCHRSLLIYDLISSSKRVN